MSKPLILSIYVQPGAKRTELCGQHGDAIKIKIKAPPVDGEANQALIEFIAKLYQCKKSQVKIKSGETSRLKRLTIDPPFIEPSTDSSPH